MSKELQDFENQHMSTMAQYALLDQQLKSAQEKLKEFKGELLTAMQEHDVKSIDNEYVKITRTKGSESTTVDLKKFQKEEPAEYGQLLEDYPKVMQRKPSIRVTVK